MSEFRIVPRTEIGLPNQVTSSTGALRRPLYNERWMTIHYTGVDVNYADIGDTPQEILAVQNWAVFSGKPWEYNYVIGQDEDNKVYEYAGEFQAAHSAGENDEAVGVLIYNGIKEHMTDTQVRKVQWLRAHLKERNILAADVTTTPHKDMPEAATPCPGALIMSRWPEILEEYSEPTAPEPVELTHVKDGLYYVRPGDSPWKVAALMYNTGAAWPYITNMNAPDTVMNPGERWKIPTLGGVDLEVLPGEGPWSIIRRAQQKPSQTSVEEFYKWNGGPDRTLRPGERVFVRYT